MKVNSDDAVADAGLSVEDAGPVLSRVERAARYLRDDLGEDARIADLGASSAGINLNLTDQARSELLDQLTPALLALGFK